MSKTVKRLGRGLDSLVSNLRTEAPEPQGAAVVPKTAPATAEPPASPPARHQLPVQATPPHAATQPPSGTPSSSRADGREPASSLIPVDRIRPNPYQPRRDIDRSELEPLAESIRLHGILQPITVRRVGDHFQLVAGERRWRAAQLAGLREVPVSVRVANDQQMLELALVENLQREDLNAIDRAKAYRQFCNEFGLTAEQVAERLGEDRSTATNYMRLLELEPEIQALLASGKIQMGHARSLLGVMDAARRRSLAQQAVDRQLSVRAMEELVRQAKAGRPGPAGAAKPRPANLRDMETRFEQAVKTKVSIIEGRRKGTGRLVIEYYSLDDFDRIASLLGVRAD